jgi:hypothetical protein
VALTAPAAETLREPASRAGQTPATRGRIPLRVDAPVIRPSQRRAGRDTAVAALLSFRCLWLVLLVASLAATAMCWRQTQARLREAADVTTPDSVMVQTAVWARASGKIYRRLDAPPYTPAVYGPLYYLILIGLSLLTGANFAGLLLASRLFTLACYAGLAVILWRWARRLGLPQPLAVLAPLFALGQIAFLNWNVTTRPDVPAVLASAAAVYAATAAGAPIGRRWSAPIAAGLLAGAAVMLKQTALAAPAAIALWLALHRWWPALAAFAAAAAAIPASLLGALALRGEQLRDLALLHDPYSGWRSAVGILLRKIEQYGPDALWIALALLGAAAAARAVSARRGPRPRGWELLILYFLLAWAWGLLTLGRNSGGAGNYLLEAWAVTALLAAAGVAALRPIWTLTPAAARSLVILWAAVANIAGLMAWHYRASVPLPDQAPLAQVLRGRRVLTDIPYLGVQTRDPAYLDPYLLHTLELAGLWSSRHLAARITAQRFGLVVLDISGGRANTRFRGLTRYDRRTIAALRQAYLPYCVRGVSPQRGAAAVFLPAGRRPPADLAGALRGADCRPALTAIPFFPATP